MSEHFTGGVIRRIATLATAGFVALSGAALLAPSASADDLERTPSEVFEQIEAQSWPNYSIDNPGPSVDIRFALSFLNDLGFITPDPGDEFTEEVEATISEFDDHYNLNDDSTLESQTWIKIRNLHFPNEADAYEVGDRGWAVIGIKAILNEKFGADLDETSGLYDEDTAAAVEVAQEELGIGVDGAFGWLSYKGVVTYQGDEDAADASASDVAVEEAPVEGAESDGEDAPEAAEDAEAGVVTEGTEEAERERAHH
ncbi:MAG TPA: peptidoglycan-binding protein [Nocardiopsis listeri]|uniref:peptidoglycan-binding domain-containing protein n=1 Tax=Nocardiopsis listeri TaxID=53440 RepID=UPI001D8497B7|nr:peptidoglycan-binding protein [Nocardiopsis listeri]HJE61369.1 peptidoglycan-binding protein [Nocardiopsis listeri]